DGRLLHLGREEDTGPISLHALDRAGSHQIEPYILGVELLLLAACKLDQLGDQRRHLTELLDDVAQEPLALTRWQRALAREHLDVRAQARDRRSQLVRRVRDELPLRARRLLERSEHRV